MGTYGECAGPTSCTPEPTHPSASATAGPGDKTRPAVKSEKGGTVTSSLARRLQRSVGVTVSFMNTGDDPFDTGWIQYGQTKRRLHVWRRVVDRLSARNIQYCFDGFLSMSDAGSAVDALQASGIRAHATLTGSGPTVIVMNGEASRAASLMAPYLADPHSQQNDASDG